MVAERQEDGPASAKAIVNIKVEKAQIQAEMVEARTAYYVRRNSVRDWGQGKGTGKKGSAYLCRDFVV